jgi:sulfhydrogenase subunit alpha
VSAARKPTLAVWKFASCDGCQLSLLDCEDELLALAGEVEIAYFLEATRATAEGPYDLSLVEGSVTTHHDMERIREVRRASRALVTIGACATAGGVQALKNFADVDEYVSVVYATPDYISTLESSTPISAHVPVDFELNGCPINKRQLLEVISAFLHGRRPNIPSTSVCMECKRRGTVCVLQPRLLRLLRPDGDAQHPRAHASAREPRDGRQSRRPGLPHVQRPAVRGGQVRMTEKRTKTIKTDYLARVEGEGAMIVRIAGGEVEEVKLNIYEPPRFFEAFLRGRGFTEAPDITARICGICPVAYQMSSVTAMEMACGVEVDGQLLALRRLLYCGEWIESHALHVFMLHAPDFLGYESAIDLARDSPGVVASALELKKTGNELMTVVGGREVHPINVKVGGWYRAPRKRELAALVPRLERAREIALEAVRITAGFDFPDYSQDYELVALDHPGEYPIDRGRIVSTRGLDIAVHSQLIARGSYLCGPLARFALAADRLSPVARDAAREVGLDPSERNPFRSIVVRCVELVYAADEALRIIAEYEEPDVPSVSVEPRAGVGYGCTEAPRGILYHRYELADDGSIVSAQIVPPTSQNQPAVEADLTEFVQRNLELDRDELTLRCEQAIRNYDPCISCATHFLDLDLVQE